MGEAVFYLVFAFGLELGIERGKYAQSPLLYEIFTVALFEKIADVEDEVGSFDAFVVFLEGEIVLVVPGCIVVGLGDVSEVQHAAEDVIGAAGGVVLVIGVLTNGTGPAKCGGVGELGGKGVTCESEGAGGGLCDER